MRFHAEQRFVSTPEAVFALYAEPRLYEALVGLPKVSAPEVLDEHQDGTSTILRVRYHFAAPLPAAALAVIDPHKLSWVDETTFTRETLTTSTRLLADHYPDRFSCTARASFVTDPGDAARSLRRIEGELRVSMLLVGGQVERAIVSGLKEHLVDEERVVNGLLARGR